MLSPGEYYSFTGEKFNVKKDKNYRNYHFISG